MQDEEGRQELLNPARDVSSGAEPCKVSLVGLSQDQVVRLSSLQVSWFWQEVGFGRTSGCDAYVDGRSP